MTPYLHFDMDVWQHTEESIRGKVCIYALVDPDDGDIRYIGKTIRPRGRFNDHVQERSRTHRSHWIQSLLRDGKLPEIAIMQVLEPDEDWQEAERAWIAALKDQGCRLTNGTSGGDGVKDLNLDSRQRISAAWRGRKHRPESLEKIGAASRLRRHTKEWCEDMSARFRGREFSAETRAKIGLKSRKLTDAQVREIRKLLADGVTHVAIAKRYGVDQKTIGNIKHRVFYADVPEARE